MAKKIIKRKAVAKKAIVKSSPASKKIAKKVSGTKKAAPVKKTTTAKKAAPVKKQAPSKKASAPKKAVAVKKATAPKKAAPVKKVTPKALPKKVIVTKKVVEAKGKSVSKKAVVTKVAPVKAEPKKSIPTVTKTKVIEEKAIILEDIDLLEPKPETKTRRRKVVQKGPAVEAAPIKTRPVVLKQLAKPLGNNRKSEIIVPKIAKPIQIEAKDKMPLKKLLMDKCIDIQKHVINTAKKAMTDAQESANDEKSSNDDMSDSFRETMHATRDVYARQVQEGVNTLGLLNRIIIKPQEIVKFGAVVITDFQNYFISAGLGEVKIDDKSFVTVSTLTPLYQILSEKKKGDLFMFLDRKYRILDVF